MALDLTDDDAHALANHLRNAIGNDHFPLAPRLDRLKAILAKLAPPAPRPEPPAPLLTSGELRGGRGQRR